MADNLDDDEWWSEKGPKVISIEQALTENIKCVQPRKRKKLSINTPVVEEIDVEEILPVLSKRKKRKRKTKTQELAENKTPVEPKKEFLKFLNAYIEKKLSALEKEDFNIPGTTILELELPPTNIIECFQEKLPKCLQVLKKNLKLPGCPLVLVLTGSAIRAVDMKRCLQVLTPEVLIAKLFAKHMKIKEQQIFLEKNIIKIAVGTPKRISELLDLDALSLDRLRYIMIDWHWRDTKLRRMVDIPELKLELMEVFIKHFGLKVIKDNVRIVLL